jgi:hypothetical protein
LQRAGQPVGLALRALVLVVQVQEKQEKQEKQQEQEKQKQRVTSCLTLTTRRHVLRADAMSLACGLNQASANLTR